MDMFFFSKDERERYFRGHVSPIIANRCLSCRCTFDDVKKSVNAKKRTRVENPKGRHGLGEEAFSFRDQAHFQCTQRNTRESRCMNQQQRYVDDEPQPKFRKQKDSRTQVAGEKITA